MEFKNLVKKNLGNHCRGKGVLETTEVSIFGNSINYHHNDLFVTYFGIPIIKYIEIYFQIVASIQNGCNSP